MQPLLPRRRASAWVIALAMLLLLVIAAGSFAVMQSTRAGGARAIAAAKLNHDVEGHAAGLVQAVLDAKDAAFSYALTPTALRVQAFRANRNRADAEMAALDRGTADLPELRASFLPVQANYKSAIALIDGLATRPLSLEQHGRVAALRIESAAGDVQALRDSAAALQAKAHARATQNENLLTGMRAQIDSWISFLAALFLTTIAFTLFWVYGERRALQDVARRLGEANTEIDAARQRAEDADTAKSRFLALASHDMRQPLHAMTLYLAALRRRVDNEQAKSIIDSMDMAAQSLTRMFSGLLDLARIESGVLKANPVAFPLQEAFDSLAREAALDAATAKVKLHIVPTSAVVVSDPELLESVLRNLLTNAIKYAPGGRVLIGCRRRGDRVRVEVRDEGPGIAKDKLIMVFGEFVRLDSSKTKGVDGLGLGLSIAARLARLLGVSLDVESEAGKGACFHLSLPIAPPDARAAPEHALHSPVQLEGVRIAVKDDEPLSLEAMARVLADAGAQVKPYSNASAFVKDIVAGVKYDLVIGDPVLLRESRLAGALADEARPPIIVLTGATDAASLASFYATKAELLIKPVAEDLLLATASRVARERTPATREAPSSPRAQL